jgi:hypothetical protein
LEALEDRTLLSAYVVTTTADSGPGSLRDAITVISADVNPDGSSKLSYTGSDPTRDEIDFAISTGLDPVTKVATIAPNGPLPPISNAVVINGYSQPGAKPNCLSGPGALGVAPAGASSYGDDAMLKVQLDGEGAGDATGLSLQASNITVQGLVINRFTHWGIDIHAYNAVIAGDFIGTDVTGTTAYDSAGQHLGNGSAGIYVESSYDTIGGTALAARNIISGTWAPAGSTHPAGDGIYIEEDFPANTGNVIEGNFIGTDHTGTTTVDSGGRSLGNAGDGILTFAVKDTTVGGPTAGADNLISGNAVNGVEVEWPFGITDDLVQGNFIGTDVTGTRITDGAGHPLDNGNAAMWMNASYDLVRGNLISNNPVGTDKTGILAFGFHNRFEGNFFGTDVTGTNALNAGAGGGVSLTGSNNTIGGLDTNASGDPLAGAGNLFAAGAGIGIGGNFSGPSSNNVVEGNYMGTDITGTKLLGEGSSIEIGDHDATNNTIGGATAAARNIIVGNSEGIKVQDDSSSSSVYSNVVEGNYIGTDVFGTHALGEFNTDVRIAAAGNTIGGTTAGAGNVIAGAGGGIILSPGGTDGNGVLPSDNLIEGNLIGTDYTGTKSLSNPGIDILIQGGVNNTIGGTTQGAGNLIVGNANTTANGVALSGGSGNAILGNSISNHHYLGIELDFGANHNQAAPVLTTATSSSAGTTVTGTLASVVNSTFRIEFFSNRVRGNAGYGEGQTYLGFTTVTTDSSGNATFTASLSAVPAGQLWLSATATVANADGTFGDTSQFARDVAVPSANAGDPYTMTYGGSVTLDASASYDPDGDALTYAWSINGQANAATGVNPTLTWAQLQAAGVTGAGMFTVSVTVNDGNGSIAISAPVTVTVGKATPSFSLSGPQVIEDGTGHTTLSGLLTYGAFIPTGNVTVAVNNVSQTVPLGSDGSFSATLATGSLGVGSLTITYSYGGDANFTAASATGVLDVTYGILALYDTSHAKKAGSTLPVQIELVNVSGQDVSSANVTVTAVGIAPASNPSAVQPAQSPGNSNPGGLFQFQGGKQPFYLFNLAIPNDLAAGTYLFYFTVAGDPIQHSVQFTVK